MFGKSKFIFTGVCLVLGSLALAASKPLYTEKTSSVQGKYEVRGNCSWDGKIEVIGWAYGMEILFDDTWGGVVKTELLSDRKILKFDLENDLYYAWDDLGCRNITYAKGVIYPKKIKGKWVPQIKLHLNLKIECLVDDGDSWAEDEDSWAEPETCTFVRKS